MLQVLLHWQRSGERVSQMMSSAVSTGGSEHGKHCRQSSQKSQPAVRTDASPEDVTKLSAVTSASWYLECVQVGRESEPANCRTNQYQWMTP